MATYSEASFLDVVKIEYDEYSLEGDETCLDEIVRAI